MGSLNSSHKFRNMQVETVFREKLVSWHWLKIMEVGGNYVACRLGHFATWCLVYRLRQKLYRTTWSLSSTFQIILKHFPGVTATSCDLIREGAPCEPVPPISPLLWNPSPMVRQRGPLFRSLLHYHSDKLFFACSFYSQGILKMSDVLLTTYPT